MSLIDFMKKHFDYDTTENSFVVYPEQKNCSCCLTPLLMKMKTNCFFLLPVILSCKIYSGECPKCSDDTIYSFSGDSLGFINYNNSILIGNEVIKEYMDLYSSSGLPFNSWFKDRILSLNSPMNCKIAAEKNLRNYTGTLHEAFCLGAETFVLNEESFICCKNPKILLMDGVVISIKSANMPKFESPWIMEKVNYRASKRSERQFKALIKIEKEHVDSLIKGDKIGLRVLNVLRNSSNVGLQCLSYSLMEKNKSYELNISAKLFAIFLCKKVASVKSLVPEECLLIIKR